MDEEEEEERDKERGQGHGSLRLLILMSSVRLLCVSKPGSKVVFFLFETFIFVAIYR